MKQSLLVAIVLSTAVCFWFFLSSSTDGVVGHYYSAGPAASGIDRTGGPLSGGATCAACHGGGSGSTTISFVLKNASNVTVTSYLPGVSYTAQFQVTSSFPIKGFQAVALNSANLQAGNFTAFSTSQSTISTLGGRQYPEHQGSSGSGTFWFTWVAPVSGTGNVTFYACGNGVNGNGAPVGDLSSVPISSVIFEGVPATINYLPTQVCNTSANLTPTITGATGGSFSALPSGLQMNIGTGIVNPTLSLPGTYIIKYTYPAGTATDTLSIKPEYNVNNNASICIGDSVFIAGAWRTTPGVYTFTGNSVFGCDSIVSTTLSVNQPSSSSSTYNVCSGDSVMIGNQYFSSAGNFNIITQNVNGCDSTISANVVTRPEYNDVIFLTICQGESLLFGGNLLTSSGTYINNGQTSYGCDSITTLNLGVTPVNSGITNNSPTLVAQAAGASYQWLDCGNNYAVIAGATNQSFSPTVNGSYAVKVTQQNCVDTSACETVANVGLEEKAFGEVKLFPNPSEGVLGLLFSQTVNADLSLIDINGKVLFTDKIEGTKSYSRALELEAGMYFVEIKWNDTKTQIIWVVK